MRIAVVGSGISGMVAAHLLHREHRVTVFEASDYVGGHTNTAEVELGARRYDVDTGFIVYNTRTYPLFIGLLERLGVETQPTTMSFSVKCERTGFEYSGRSLNALFARRMNAVDPGFLWMLREIRRFYRESRELLSDHDDGGGPTLGEYVLGRGYSERFVAHYIVPMGSAIWSASPQTLWSFPARYFVRFFDNHGMLGVGSHHQWRVIRGGSRRYVEKLVAPFRDRIRLRAPVGSIRRCADRVEVALRSGERESFDRVVIATHSDQALAMLADASEPEREILGAIRYQENEAVLHTDASLLPRRRRAWSAWNYIVPRHPQERVAVTYSMNILQGLDAPEQFCVTLNHADAIDPARVLRRITYHHPVYMPEAVAAQKRHAEINDVNRTLFCGAYWGFGFHEDGVRSAYAACARLTASHETAEQAPALPAEHGFDVAAGGYAEA